MENIDKLRFPPKRLRLRRRGNTLVRYEIRQSTYYFSNITVTSVTHFKIMFFHTQL